MTTNQVSGVNPRGGTTGVPVASAGGAFVVVNNIVLLTATVLGAFATLYADLFPRSSLGQQRTALALGWVACIVLSMLVLGYHDKASSGNPLKRITWGARVMWENAGYAFLVLFMSGAALFCAYGKLTGGSEQPGVLKSLVATADRMERVALETRDLAQRAAEASESTDRKADTLIEQGTRIEGKLNRPQGPREQLAAQGIAWDGAAFGQALMAGDVPVVELFLKGGLDVRTAAAPRGEEGNALGYFLALSPATDPDKTTKLMRMLAAKVDTTAPVAQFRGIPPMNFITLALHACNVPVAQAIAAAGLDTKRVNKAYMATMGDPFLIDALADLRANERHVIDGRQCTDGDRRQLLQIAMGATTR